MKQIKLKSGQIISEKDPNYKTYLKQGAVEIEPTENKPPEAQNAPSQAFSGQSGVIDQNAQTGAENSLTARVQATQGSLRANPNFVNAVYKAYYNRDAKPEELKQWSGKTVDEIRRALTPKVEEPLTVNQQPKYLIPTAQDNTDAFIKSVSKLWENLNQPTDTEKQYQNLIFKQEQQLMDLYGKAGKKPQRQLELEQQFDIAGKEQKIQQTQAEMQQKIAEYNLMKEKVAAEPILTASIAGQQAHLKRVLAAEIAVDSAKLAAYQGQYDLAEKQIQRALDQEFGAIKNNIDTTKTFLDLNYKHFTEAQKKHADKIKFVLDKMEKLYEEQRADREDNYKILLNVLANGGDGSTVDFSKSPEENLINNADYLSDKGLTTKTIKAGGREWLVTYDVYGNVINKVDMGSAYKGTSGGGSTGGEGNDEADFYISEIQSGNPLYFVKDAVGSPTDQIDWTKIPSKLRPVVKERISKKQEITQSQAVIDTLFEEKQKPEQPWYKKAWNTIKSLF